MLRPFGDFCNATLFFWSTCPESEKKNVAGTFAQGRSDEYACVPSPAFSRAGVVDMVRARGVVAPRFVDGAER